MLERLKLTKFMNIDVFEGGNGDLVLCQEYSTPREERYLRIITDMRNAEELCEAIMQVARKARAK